jgi:hypothetical protein
MAGIAPGCGGYYVVFATRYCQLSTFLDPPSSTLCTCPLLAPDNPRYTDQIAFQLSRNIVNCPQIFKRVFILLAQFNRFKRRAIACIICILVGILHYNSPFGCF